MIFCSDCEIRIPVPPGGGTLYRQATQMNEGILGYFYELPGGNKFPPGDASLLTRFSGSMLFGRFLIGEKDGER